MNIKKYIAFLHTVEAGNISRSARELGNALRRKGYVQPAIEAVVARLTESGLIDDARYAQRMAETQVNKPVGIYALKRKLRAKGISEADAERVQGVGVGEEVFGVAGEGMGLLRAAGAAEGEGDGRMAGEAGGSGGEVEGAIEEEIAGGDVQVLAEGVQRVELDALCVSGGEGGEGGAGEAGVLGVFGEGEPALGQQHGEIGNEHGASSCRKL